MGFKNKKAAAFDSYGWYGEHIDVLEENLRNTKLDLIEWGIKVLWNPDDDAMKECFELGKSFVEKL